MFGRGKRLSRNARRRLSHQQMETVQTCIDRGRELYNSRSYSAAIEQFRQAVTIDPYNQRAFYFLANACYKANERNLAVAYWEQCVSANPLTRFASLAKRKIQHVHKQRRAHQDELDELYNQVGGR